MTVSELSAYWLETYASQHKAESSLIHDKGLLKNQILPEFSARVIGELSPWEVEQWMNRLRLDQRLSPKSCNHALGLLRKMLNDAVRWQFIRYNPIASVKPFRIDQQDFSFWTRDEAVRFMSHAQIFEDGVFPVFAVALYTGLRKGELRGLKWDCINLDQRQITVKRSFCQKSKKLKETTKSKKIRHVPINKSLFEVLVGLKNQSNGVFVLPDFHYHHCYRVMQKLAKAADVKAIRFHDLRHTFASHFMMAGGSIYDLQRLLGHSTIAMTERYSHMSPNHLAGKTEILDFETREKMNVLRMGDFRKKG
jgi:integrase